MIAMKPSLKMGAIVLVGICVIFLQYHLSTGVRFDQLAVPAGDVSSDLYSYPTQQRISEDAIRAAVETVRLANGLGPDIGTKFIAEILYQLNKTMKIEKSKPTPSSTSPTLADTVPLYIITPTYRRPEQVPELTRMAHTLMLVKNVYWLVIEDAKNRTEQVTELLQRTGLKFEHLVAPMPEQYKLKKGAKPRGVSNRNRGLQWIRENAKTGVFYFADDDNTYDISLFDEMRKTQKVSMWPVGLCTKFGLSTPIVKDGKFQAFYDGWIAGRKFPVDMAGFAIGVQFLLQRPNAMMPFKPGFEEDGFLKSLAPFEPKEIELLADNCTRILAWHTQTKKNEPSAPLDTKKYAATNLIGLKRLIV